MAGEQRAFEVRVGSGPGYAAVAAARETQEILDRELGDRVVAAGGDRKEVTLP